MVTCLFCFFQLASSGQQEAPKQQLISDIFKQNPGCMRITEKKKKKSFITGSGVKKKSASEKD